MSAGYRITSLSSEKMDRIGLDKPTFNLFDRLNENVGRVADELERLNDNLEGQDDE